MHHGVVPQLYRPQINDLAGRPSYGLLKEVDQALLSYLLGMRLGGKSEQVPVILAQRFRGRR